MNQRKCKTCGATIEHLYNHKCPYCRNFIDFNIQKTEDINPRYMYDVEVRNIEYDYVANRIVMYFKGKYLKASESLEYVNDNTLMKIDYESTIPKDVMYAISFDKQDFYEIIYHGNIYKFIERFPFEMDTHKLTEALIKYTQQNKRW